MTATRVSLSPAMPTPFRSRRTPREPVQLGATLTALRPHGLTATVQSRILVPDFFTTRHMPRGQRLCQFAPALFATGRFGVWVLMRIRPLRKHRNGTRVAPGTSVLRLPEYPGLIAWANAKLAEGWNIDDVAFDVEAELRGRQLFSPALAEKVANATMAAAVALGVTPDHEEPPDEDAPLSAYVAGGAPWRVAVGYTNGRPSRVEHQGPVPPGLLARILASSSATASSAP